jgi:hypothetical protein
MNASLSSVLCANATLKSNLDSASGFISAAFLSVDTEMMAEIWVVRNDGRDLGRRRTR